LLAQGQPDQVKKKGAQRSLETVESQVREGTLGRSPQFSYDSTGIGEVEVLQMLTNVKQVTIAPLIQGTILLIYTDECKIPLV